MGSLNGPRDIVVGRASLFNAATLVALFIAALFANLRLAGPSPIVWLDTFNDELEVRRCLVDDSCTLTGVSTSVPGLAHAVAWLELRTLLAWLGVGLDGAHLVMQLLNALALVLVFHLATQLGGRLAGVAAAWIFIDRIEALGQVAALHNSSVLPFLGTVLVLACTAVVLRPGVASVALAALVGAVMANVHMACVMTGASVVWVALTAPRRRLRLAAFGAVLFLLATFAMAPPTWLHNLTSLLADRAASGGAPAALTVPNNAMMGWALFALCAWVVSLAIRAPAWVEYRRIAQGALAVMVPFLAVFLAAPLVGLNPEAKYLFHLKAACAIAAALPLALVADALLRPLSPPRLVGAIERILPLALAVGIALAGRLGVSANVSVADDVRPPTVAEVDAVARILGDERGWDVSRMVANLRTPYGIALLTGLRQIVVAAGGAQPGVADSSGSALLLRVEPGELPDPLPPSWKLIGRSAGSVTVLVFMQSRIDWSAFEVCVRPAGAAAPRCEQSGWRFDEATGIVVPHMPPGGQGWRGTLQLTLPLRPAAPGSGDEIFMPRMGWICNGGIASLPAGETQVDADRRRASILAAETDDASPPTIKLEWDVGSPECDGVAYDGLPPFFVEGDPATVQVVEAILRRRETR